MIDFINGIIPNICILLALTLIYAYILKYLSNFNKLIISLVSGIFFGSFAIYGMMSPYILTPGLIFDGRSIILCASGIVVGFWGTLITIFFAGIYRIYLGGSGVLMGVFVIVSSGLIGALYGWLRNKKTCFDNALFIYITGILSHIVMLTGTLLLPVSVRFNVLSKIYLPILIIYPIATLFFTMILDHQKKMQLQYEEVIHGRIKLKNSFLKTLNAISKAIEAKDEYTKNHQQRVANLAVAIALQRSWTNSQILEIYIASLFHDIGKLIVPINILNKNDTLVDSEYEIVKQHCLTGYNIFHQLDFHPWVIDKIIFQHHEKLDGSGYPKGLRDKKINKAARLLAVCDTFDALTTNRAYRKAITIDEAIDFLKKASGVTLEEKYVTSCIKIIKHESFDIKKTSPEFEKIFCDFFSTDKMNI